MANLVDAMKKLHADNFAFYLKSHYYHWNVEDKDFKEFHAFFEEIYQMAWDDADSIAEHIRAINAYAPGSLGRFAELTSIVDDMTVPIAIAMVQNLYDDLQKVCDSIMVAYTAANDANEIGLSNFLQDKYDSRKKLAWQLRATLARH